MSSIGIIGGGQLGRMLALAAYPLGAHVLFLEPSPDAPMRHLANQICGAYDDERALEQLAHASDVVTYEFENVPVTSPEYISQFTKIFPPPEALRVAQDRWHEKHLFASLNIPTAKFARVNSLSDLGNAVREVGLPAVLKTRRMGYDGKGQFVIETLAHLPRAWSELGSVPLILEAFVPLTRELSLLAVRGQDGTVAYYPLVENHHRDGILRLSLAPAPNTSRALQQLAQAHVQRILDTLDYVGLLAVEFFQVGNELLANEMAPRVHNSGHWTIEGAESSQFENHIRAITGLPLGSTQPRGHSAMLNFIGTLPDVNALLPIPGAHLHLYDKAPRAGRKLGHVTIVAHDSTTRDERLAELERIRKRFSKNTDARVES